MCNLSYHACVSICILHLSATLCRTCMHAPPHSRPCLPALAEAKQIQPAHSSQPAAYCGRHQPGVQPVRCVHPQLVLRRLLEHPPRHQRHLHKPQLPATQRRRPRALLRAARPAFLWVPAPHCRNARWPRRGSAAGRPECVRAQEAILTSVLGSAGRTRASAARKRRSGAQRSPFETSTGRAGSDVTCPARQLTHQVQRLRD